MSLFWAPLIGIQPQQDPGITSGEMGWARETERDRERMNVAVKKVEESKRLIFLGLHRKPIKPRHGTCSVHEGLRRPLDVAKAQSTFLTGS